jgi:hypothetical protein
MESFYTVDRNRKLQVGQQLDCDTNYAERKFYPVSPHYSKQDLQTLIQELYPQGISSHGKQYLLDQCLVVKKPNGTPASVCPVVPIMELVVELIRRVSFPTLPSRFTSIFGWDTKEDAISFRTSHCGNNGNICRLSAELGFRGDMTLLCLGGTILGSWLYATRYWRGLRSPFPRVECLLLAPAVVEEIVQE